MKPVLRRTSRYQLFNRINAYRGSCVRRRIFVPIYLTVRLLLVALIAPRVAFSVNLAASLSDQDIAVFLQPPYSPNSNVTDTNPLCRKH